MDNPNDRDRSIADRFRSGEPVDSISKASRLSRQRIYQIDGSSKLHTYDLATGKELWSQQLGTLQKASPVLADGKLYVGTETGTFFIVRPLADRAEVLSEVELPNSTNSCCGSEGTPEQILAGAAVSRGRIFFVSSDAVYAIGSKQPTSPSGFALDEPAQAGAGAKRCSGLAGVAGAATAGRAAAVQASSTKMRVRSKTEEGSAELAAL